MLPHRKRTKSFTTSPSPAAQHYPSFPVRTQRPIYSPKHSLKHCDLDLFHTEGVYNPFPNNQFTGSLHPWYPLSPRRRIPDHIPLPDYHKTGKILFLFLVLATEQKMPKINACGGATAGKPLSEIKAGGQPGRILSLEEQEKMRHACKVRKYTLDALSPPPEWTGSRPTN